MAGRRPHRAAKVGLFGHGEQKDIVRNDSDDDADLAIFFVSKKTCLQRCLNDGENWERGFLFGLFNANVVLLLVSSEMLRGVSSNASKQKDNVLLEVEEALNMSGLAEAETLLQARGENERGSFESFTTSLSRGSNFESMAGRPGHFCFGSLLSLTSVLHYFRAAPDQHAASPTPT